MNDRTKAWLAVASVAAGTFVMVTTEFLPVGLLTNVSADLGISDGTAGLMVTVPGLMGALAAPALIVAAGKLDRRIALWLLSAALILSNVIAAVAPSFPVLLIGRVLLGACVGGFWSLAPPLARRLVPEQQGDRAAAIISAGVSVGTVCGVPAGTLIGNFAGWRMAFVVTAVLAGAVLLAQILLLPRLPAAQAIRPADLFSLLRIPRARAGLVSVAFLAAGQFAGYTYLKPFLEQVPAMDPHMISGVLLAYGAAGFVGTFLGEKASGRNVGGAFIGTALLLAAVMLLAPVIGGNQTSAMVLAAIWGLAFGAVPVCVQIWMFKAAPEAFETGSALVVSTFQISIAIGSAVGGVAVDRIGVSGAMLLGGALCLITSLTLRGATERPPSAEPVSSV